MPNFRRQTVDDGIPYYYDYVNWVNVGKWFNDLEFLSTSDDGVKV